MIFIKPFLYFTITHIFFLFQTSFSLTTNQQQPIQEVYNQNVNFKRFNNKEMDRKSSDIEGFDYPDLDLSEEEVVKEKKHEEEPTGKPGKKIKTNQSILGNNQAQGKLNKTDKQPQSQTQTFRNPLPFFPPPPGAPNKGGNFWVPPPPVVQKTAPNPQNYPRSQYQKSQFSQSRDNRDKKNTVYVKNIPKSFNTQQKLMTFFKNEGAIKQIKVIQSEQMAIIRFVKQQNTTKFLKSNKIIFNRSYIVYGENENLPVSQQQINDRINDELGNVKKAEQTNMKVLKEKLSNQLAENIRALYFLENHLVEDNSHEFVNLKKDILASIDSKAQAKRFLQTQSNEQFKPQEYQTSDFQWGLSFIRKSDSHIDKKSLFTEFLKHGPLVSIDVQCISQRASKTQDQKVGNDQLATATKPQLQYRIRVVFLSVKHAWAIYCSKKNEMGLSVEGKQMRRYFESGKLKIIEVKKTHQTDSGSQTLANQPKPTSPEPIVQTVPDEQQLNEHVFDQGQQAAKEQLPS